MRAMWCGICHLVHVSMRHMAHGAWITKCERNTKVKGSFLSLGSNQGIENNLVEGEKKEKKRKERRKMK